MSAKTGQRVSGTRTEQMARFASLCVDAGDAIRGEKRAQGMTDAVLQAMQLYKQNRLAGVLSMDQFSAQDGDFDVAILSNKVAELTAIFSAKARKYLAERGVIYLGEMYQLKWDRRFETRTEIEAGILAMGLPLSMDVLANGWVPPYFGKQAFLQVLDKLADEIMHRRGHASLWALNEGYGHNWAAMHRRGDHYVGQLLDSCKRSPGSMQSMQEVLRADSGLHAGMLVPADWQAPEEVPQAWLAFLEREKVARELQHKSRKDALLARAHSKAMRADKDGVALDERMQKYPAEARLVVADECEFSVRTNNCLANQGIVYMIDLVTKQEDWLLRTRNFGRKSLREIREVLAGFGLKLGMTEAEFLELVTEPSLEERMRKKKWARLKLRLYGKLVFLISSEDPRRIRLKDCYCFPFVVNRELLDNADAGYLVNFLLLSEELARKVVADHGMATDMDWLIACLESDGLYLGMSQKEVDEFIAFLEAE